LFAEFRIGILYDLYEPAARENVLDSPTYAYAPSAVVEQPEAGGGGGGGAEADATVTVPEADALGPTTLEATTE
jgi:hypothetical protein